MERAVIKSAGSSPHTRGARHPFRNARRQLRIIPAYAGSTTTLRRPSRISWDHPRIRGEHDCSIYFTNFPTGSSPHTRGAQGDRRHPCAWVGIIPAYAGSTRIRRPRRAGRRDHPRIRGEHAFVIWLADWVAGSSPHTRGALLHHHEIISCSRDHPRIRGEHGAGVGDAGVEVGSSPHTRGAHFSPIHGARAARIIPAYAGSTGWRRRRGRSGRDHPRIRGEHVPIALIATALAGSSPHTRGARWRRTGRRPRRCGSSPHTRGAPAAPATTGGRCGIIPAYAGSTSSAALGWLSVGDHPRIRGEHIKSGFGAIKDGGSSPHTRGAQCRGWRS